MNRIVLCQNICFRWKYRKNYGVRKILSGKKMRKRIPGRERRKQAQAKTERRRAALTTAASPNTLRQMVISLRTAGR